MQARDDANAFLGSQLGPTSGVDAMDAFRQQSPTVVPEDSARELAETIIDMARVLRRSIPAPKGGPYFGVDNGVGYDLHLLDALGERGIFRKYEFALDLGCGLGGRARWIATRLGCRVLGVDSTPELIKAAILLNQHAQYQSQVSFQLASFGELPLQERLFTHVWWVAPKPISSVSYLKEAFRVLRRGGQFALQCEVRTERQSQQLLDWAASSGFFEIVGRSVQVPDPSQSWRLAMSRMDDAVMTSRTAQLWASLKTQKPQRVFQVFARRPA